MSHSEEAEESTAATAAVGLAHTNRISINNEVQFDSAPIITTVDRSSVDVYDEGFNSNNSATVVRTTDEPTQNEGVPSPDPIETPAVHASELQVLHCLNNTTNTDNNTNSNNDNMLRKSFVVEPEEVTPILIHPPERHSEDNKAVVEAELKDKYQMAYILWFFLGVGILVPFNAFVTAIDYFEVSYPGYSPGIVIPAVYMYSNLVAFAPTMKYGIKYSFTWRIITGFIIYAVLLFVVPITSEISETREKRGLWFYLICGLVFISGCMDSVVQAAIYGLSAFFPFIHIQSILSGTGMAGLFVSGIRLVTKLIFGDTERGIRISGALFFAISALYMLLCITFYYALRRLPYVKGVLKATVLTTVSNPSTSAPTTTTTTTTTTSTTSSTTSVATATSTTSPSTATTPTVTPVIVKPTYEKDSESNTVAGDGFGRLNEEEEQVYLQEEDEKQEEEIRVIAEKARSIEILRKIKLPAFVVFYTYTITMTVFPGLISAIPTTSDLMDESTYSVFLITLFNVCDFIGRTLPRAYQINTKFLFGVSLLRTVFVLIFLFSVQPHWIRSDAVTIVGVLVCALTNGYCATVGMAEAPQLVDSFEKEKTGVMMIFIAVIGLSLGSTIAFAFLKIV
eukprot:TRINITY_DN7469_c0_g1_i2.p1 TRINITY_DN7469_c0_g1~~TRINITY_DN7469_c0_g1_i2.p1  ORF type:complete len:623 (+),score=146.37 TRINITY_DN7469_c0_g1_i2:188-2056(+)